MRYFTFYSVVIMLTLLMRLPDCQASKSHHLHPMQKIIDLDVHYEPGICPFPVRELSRSLRAHPKAQQFRISWDSTALGCSIVNEALYDRNTHLMYVLLHGGCGFVWEYRFLLARVTDDMIYKLPDEYPVDVNAPPDSAGYLPPGMANEGGGFLQLKKHGAYVKLVWHYQHELQ